MKRILLVDDNCFQAQILADVLQAAGFAVVVEASVEDGLARLHQVSCDLVITDILLSQSSGFDLCRELRLSEKFSGMPVLILMNRNDPVDLLKGLSAGADNFIGRDRPAEEIVTRVRRVMELRARPSNDGPDDPARVTFQGEVFEVGARREQLLDVLVSAFEDLAAFQQQSTRYQATRVHQLQLNTQLQALNARIERLASRDPLTDVLNMRGLEQRLQQMRDSKGPREPELTLFLIRCSNLASAVTRLGYAVGDILVKECARRMQDALGPEDLLARVGGDEFLLVVPGIDAPSATQLGERLRLRITQRPVVMSMDEISPSVEIGVHRITGVPTDLAGVASRLHVALLQHESTSGRGIVSLERPWEERLSGREYFAEMARHLRLGQGLRTVVQPIHHLREKRIVAYELLTRGPTGFFELPQDFFRFCFDSNILTQVDLHCIRQSVRVALQQDPQMNFHLNVYPSTLLATPIEQFLSLFPEDPHHFCLELSEEQILGDPSTLVGPVAALKAGGFRVAIDDVGFGQSWLESLIMLEPDLVKIDKRYVAGIAGSPGLLRLLERLLRVVRALDAEVVAEGIETAEDLDTLLELGVTFGQGYLWGSPEAARAVVPPVG